MYEKIRMRFGFIIYNDIDIIPIIYGIIMVDIYLYKTMFDIVEFVVVVEVLIRIVGINNIMIIFSTRFQLIKRIAPEMSLILMIIQDLYILESRYDVLESS